jgi:hypothetical protein
MASVLSIRSRASDLLARDWSTIQLHEIVQMPPIANAEAELFAPLAAHEDCAAVRGIRIIETVRAGECIRCMRLEFVQQPPEERYVLSAIILDYSATTRKDATELLRALLQGSGAPQTAVDLPTRVGGISHCFRNWTVRNEMRFLDMRVIRATTGWQFHFDHRRNQVNGVPPASP